jgi:hypothetical protein
VATVLVRRCGLWTGRYPVLLQTSELLDPIRLVSIAGALNFVEG